ncbi:hypothetical protein [Paraburkholderia sp. BL25I1N1]|uniref:hypothetical protein n=1 Tax=Paraburkholderia sp. BL25I1N1 TaxID=1938804 RepID=UPI000D06485C|nr:hypothetical protein [Paraburkholderia sp. BL25I1N1]PRY03802.1 hypothetical protein B0G73_114123 [Paraburkholderia sp. BL25I1N1]
MKRELMDRLRRLEFSMGPRRVPHGMDEAYEHMVRLGLGEDVPDSDTEAGMRFQRGIAWYYRKLMIDFDGGVREPKDDWERGIMERYRVRLAAGAIREFEFAEEDGIW